MLAADVDLAVGILREPGRAQERLVEGGIRPLRLVGDLVLRDAVGSASRLGTRSLRFSSSEPTTDTSLAASPPVSSRLVWSGVGDAALWAGGVAAGLVPVPMSRPWAWRWVGWSGTANRMAAIREGGSRR